MLSHYLPSDTCKIYKRGTSLRMDSTLAGFNLGSSGVQWLRGGRSIVYNLSQHTQFPAGDTSSPPTMAVKSESFKLNHQKETYRPTKIWKLLAEQGEEMSPEEWETVVDDLMMQDIVTLRGGVKSMEFVRAKTGWLFNRHDKTVGIRMGLRSVNGRI